MLWYIIISYTISHSCAGSSGTFSYNFNEKEMWERNTEEYILYVTAVDLNTSDTVTLRGAFRVFGHQEKYFCGFNMINTGTDPISQKGSLEFISVGNAQKFMCEIDGTMHPCKLFNTTKELCEILLCHNVEIYGFSLITPSPCFLFLRWRK